MSARLWWFEVDEIWGYRDQECPVVIGSVLLDRYTAGTWNIMNLQTMERPGGWHARRLGEAVGEWADKPNPDWLSPLGKVQALPEDHPAHIEAKRQLGLAVGREATP